MIIGMKQKVKSVLNFVLNNWFKLILLVLVFWFLTILQDEVVIRHKGYIDLDHDGYIDLDHEGYIDVGR